MLQDFRFGLRLLGRQPGFTAAAVLTLGLGVGANAAVFAVAWQLMLKPLPVAGSERIVRVWETYDGRNINPVAPAFYHQWLTRSSVFATLAASTYFEDRVSLTGAGEPEQLTLRSVTGGYFQVFGMSPLQGRVLDARDATAEGMTVVLSEGLWRRRFAADPGVIGRDIRVRGQVATVVGVMPAGFAELDAPTDLWSALGFSPSQVNTGLAHYLAVVGRLQDGVSIAQAGSDVAVLTTQTVPKFPQLNQKLSAMVQSVDEQRAGALRPGLQSLLGAAALVLLIACANLASLQLARAVARHREFGIRAALGASRARMVRQLLAEGVVLSTLGAAAGLLLSRWILSGLSAIAPAGVRQAALAPPDAMVLAYTLGLATACALLFALVPAWRTASRAAVWLRQQVTTGDRAAATARAALVTAQVALAAILLVGASLLVGSLTRVLRVDPGFDSSGVMAFDLSLAPSKFESDAQRLGFIDRVLGELRALPGVESVCAINQIPFDSAGNMTYVPEGETRLVGALPRTVTPECFDVLRIRLIRGRLFEPREARRAGIVTERFAATAWPGQDPLGRRVHLGVPDGALIEIVGVVADSRQQSLEARPYPQFYELSAADTPFAVSRVLLRASTPAAPLFAPIRAAVRRVDPDQPVARLRALTDVVATTTASRRFNLTLVGGFAGLALVLSAVGLYGLLAELVAQRRREIGIRMALGATGTSVIRLMMTRACVAIAIGLGAGILGASFASRLLQQQLYGISPTDVRTYAGVAVLLTIVGLVAAWLPARRAARVDPVAALKQ